MPGSVEPPKSIVAYLPLGFLGDVNAAAQCTELQFRNGDNLHPACPPASRVGTLVFFEENIVSGTVVPANESGTESAIYNITPQGGYPARFGLKISGVSIPLYASVVHTSSGYGLRVASPGLPTTLHVEGVALTFFGDPRAVNGEPNASHAFFTNPDNCSAGPLRAKVQADSWVAPDNWVKAESVAFPQLTGCNLLQFEPTVEMRPEVTQAESPSGYEIKIKVPQNPASFPVLATPQIKDVTLSLPEGVTITPGGGDGLVGCEATGPHGIDMPTGDSNPFDVGTGGPGERGEEIGQEGLTQLVAGHCPAASQIGTVKITTPVLKKPLEGHLYIAQPKCGGAGQPACSAQDATNGNIFGLYLEAGSEEAAAVVKLAGSVSVDSTTGRVTARFNENPQVPVSEVDLQLYGGARSPLANPRQCGSASANGDLVPWSSPVTPDAVISSAPFMVDWDGSGTPCPAVPFTPTLSAGPTNVQAGHFSPFTLTLSRGDRQQDLSKLQVRMPPGLLGMLSKVQLCGEPAAERGECDEASNIGTVNVAAGSGPHPLWVTGKVYLTGPYNGAPFGLTIVVPAVAGPFNLGNVVVRSRIDIDPTTSAVIITSDPLPQLRDGVPLRIQTLNVAVTRNGFIFNPTHCAGLQVAATAESTQGALANLSSPVSMEGCKSLPFKPGFKVSTASVTSKALGASLEVKVTSTPGQANIAGVAVKLPRQLPARLSTLQHACLAEVFANNPALCDPKSLVGVVQATTPVLPVKLVGPAYLVSHGGAAFPDLVVVLQGDGVRINLAGNTDIVKGITSSTFASVPDAPIESFRLQLPRGPHSALTSNVKTLCGQSLKMPTTITGQNGAQIKQTTSITVTGCPKAKKKKAKPKRAKHRTVKSVARRTRA